MLNINKFESKHKSFVTFNGDVKDLFESIRVEKHCSNSPNGDAKELTLSLPNGFYNGKSYYIRPTEELNPLLKEYNIYGDPQFKDVYLSIDKFGSDDHFTLSIKYQQILGSYKLISISNNQFNTLLNDLGYSK
jgi:hypothetical protein